jgi:hypothetical protein
MARQLGRSRIATLLVAEAGLLRGPEQEHGLSHIVRGEAEAAACVRDLDEHLALLGFGDLHDLLEQVPSGRVEEALGLIAQRFACVIIAPPVGDFPLLNRLARAVDCCVAVVEAHDRESWRLVEAVGDLERPVALALLA